MNRAFLVGINNYPQAPLRGCVNDVVDMASFLVSDYGFQRSEIRLLTDERATTDAIFEHLNWLVSGVRPGDRAIFHYSGHGVQLPTINAQGEVDGLDEAICPIDFDWTDEHTIRDKDFYKIFTSISSGTNFVWISDSCHSGDLTKDLKFRPKQLHPPADINWSVETAKEKIRQRRLFPNNIGRAADTLNLAFISGCRSDQTSDDAEFSGRPNGALTYFLLKELASSPNESLEYIVGKVSTALKPEHTQEPQIEGSMRLRLLPFLEDEGEQD